MKPERNGRKIAELSEFTNLDDSDKSIVDVDEFQALFISAGLDVLYTAHFFSEHINVLPDKSIWKNHSFDISDINT